MFGHSDLSETGSRAVVAHKAVALDDSFGWSYVALCLALLLVLGTEPQDPLRFVVAACAMIEALRGEFMSVPAERRRQSTGGSQERR